jgi:hypothetical protein
LVNLRKELKHETKHDKWLFKLVERSSVVDGRGGVVRRSCDASIGGAGSGIVRD